MGAWVSCTCSLWDLVHYSGGLVSSHVYTYMLYTISGTYCAMCAFLNGGRGSGITIG